MYENVYQEVETELLDLDEENARLSESIRAAQTRLTEIALRREKLLEVARSLADLLSLNAAETATEPTNSESASIPTLKEQNLKPDETTATTAQTITAETLPSDSAAFVSPHQPPVETVNTDAPIVLESVAAVSSAQTGDSGEGGENRNVAANAAQPPESSMPEERGAEENSPLEAETTEELSVENFDPKQFFARFPHLENANQPAHVLSANLLTYFGRGLTLEQLARLLVAIGYRHNSKNFTNTLHSALKSKRTNKGEFYYYPKDQLWELPHWRTPETVPAAAKTMRNNQPEKSAAPAKKVRSIRRAGAASGAATEPPQRGKSGASDANSKRGIKVIKKLDKN